MSWEPVKGPKRTSHTCGLLHESSSQRHGGCSGLLQWARRSEHASSVSMDLGVRHGFFRCLEPGARHFPCQIVRRPDNQWPDSGH